MWFKTSYKKPKETIKNQNRRFYYINLAPELRNHQKCQKETDHSTVICSIFFLGITYFGWYLVNPHVQAVQNMYAKARLQFSKYRFHNESASSHDLWKATNSLWNWYFQNCGRACLLGTSYFANGLHFYALNKLSISCYDIFFVKSAQPSGPLCFLKCF